MSTLSSKEKSAVGEEGPGTRLKITYDSTKTSY